MLYEKVRGVNLTEYTSRLLMRNDPEICYVEMDSHFWYQMNDAQCECDGLCTCSHQLERN